MMSNRFSFINKTVPFVFSGDYVISLLIYTISSKGKTTAIRHEFRFHSFRKLSYVIAWQSGMTLNVLLPGGISVGIVSNFLIRGNDC